MKTDNYTRLKEMQQWTFEQKLCHTIENIQVFANRMGKVAVSFSGGKDSTVLLDICRRYCDKDMKAFFINTTNEYPEIVRFVKTFDNVDFVKPKLNFKKTIEQYGFPLISKQNAQYFRQAKHGTQKIKELRLRNNSLPWTLSQKYRRFLRIENLELSEQCCDILKKRPSNKYVKDNEIKGIFIGTRVAESRRRKGSWLKLGTCNNYAGGKSNPLSIWDEKDINRYIVEAKLPICELYNQGFDRTGCMFCGFGCKGINDFRFRYLRENKPKLYEYMMSISNSGITFKEAIQMIYGNEIEF